MLIVLSIVAAQSSSLRIKDVKKIDNGRNNIIHVKPKVDECYDANEAKVSGLTDTANCPAAYINLYKKLPADGAPPTSELSTYKQECGDLKCTDGCYELLVTPGSNAFDENFKTSYKTNCMPTDAASLYLDVCTKGDDTPASSLTDEPDCITVYDALIELLPNPTGSRKANISLLTAESDAFTSFTTHCRKSICDKSTCYNAIGKDTPSAYNAALKDLIIQSCNLHPTGPPVIPPIDSSADLPVDSSADLSADSPNNSSDDSPAGPPADSPGNFGFSAVNPSILLLLITFFLTNITFWL
jgi:hypothetical protein